jgi:hypothetical protein
MVVMTLLAVCSMLISCLAYSSTMKMEATCYSETLVDFQRKTRRYIPEDMTNHLDVYYHFYMTKCWPSIYLFQQILFVTLLPT